MGKKTISIAGYLWIYKKYDLINEIQIKIIRIINFYSLKYIQSFGQELILFPVRVMELL